MIVDLINWRLIVCKSLDVEWSWYVVSDKRSCKVGDIDIDVDIVVILA